MIGNIPVLHGVCFCWKNIVLTYVNLNVVVVSERPLDQYFTGHCWGDVR